jgi:hypothetical protein
VAQDSKVLDTKPDARLNPPAAAPVLPAATGLAAAAGANTGAGTAAKPAADAKLAGSKPPAYEPLPSNYTPKKVKASKKKSKKTQTQQAAPPPTPPADTTPKVVDATSTATQKPE